MQAQHPALARAIALQTKFNAHIVTSATAPIAAPCAMPVDTPAAMPSISQLEARADDLRQKIISYEAQFKDPILNRELNLCDQYEALIDEADEELSAINAQLETLEIEAQTTAPRKSYYSNTAYARSVDTEYYGRGYVSARSKNFRSCYVWRVGKPDHPVDESNEESSEDPYHDEDGEPLYVAHCESREMATALCALLNSDDSILIPR